MMDRNTNFLNNEKKRVVKIIALAAVIVAALYLCNSCASGKGTLKNIYSEEKGSGCKVAAFSDGAVVVNYDGAKFISENGEVKAEAENQMTSPHVSVCERYMLLYDKNGCGVALYRDMKKVYFYESESAVKIAKVNKNGYALIVTDEIGYNAGITVLTPKGKVEYIWKIGDVYVVDADIAPDNQRLAVAAISTDAGVVDETIIFADTYKEKELGRTTSKGSVPLCVKFANSGVLTAVSDDKLSSYSSSGECRWSVPFENKLLTAFCIEDGGNTVLALSGIKNNTIIQAYTKNGSKSGEYTTESEVSFIDAKGKYIALFEPSKVSVITFSGKLAEEFETQKDFKGMVMLGRKKIMLVGNDGIDLLGL